MKSNNALQVIFAFFLGLVVVAFVGIGVNTFYPEPVWTETNNNYDSWRLTTGIVLLVCATLLLAISLFLPAAQAVLSNGILLGGVFTMIYAVGMTVSASQNVLRFVVVTLALAITIGIGYLKFAHRGHLPAPAADAMVAGPPASDQGELAVRLAAVEQKLDALGRALRD